MGQHCLCEVQILGQEVKGAGALWKAGTGASSQPLWV